ncbi:MAG: hypothetical protein V4747_04245 [Pseudomonadota bacterium]
MTAFTYFEPLIDGHCAFFAELVTSGALRDPRISRVQLVTDPALVDRLGSLDSRIELTALPKASLFELREGGLLARGRAQWAEACRLGADTGGAVFLPFFDHAVVGAALARGRGAGEARISGIVFRPPNRHGLRPGLRSSFDTARRWATYALARGPSLGRLFTFDEVAPVSCVGRLTGTLHFLPDAAPDVSLLAACRPIQRPDGRAVALLFGALTARKGLFEIVDAWARQSDDWLDGRVLRLVGLLGNEERPRFQATLENLSTARPRALIELHDQFVDDATLAQEIVNADLILAPYQNHVGSSGVVFWACAAGKPLLTQNTGLVGYQAQKYQLGRTVDCTDVASLSVALAEPWEILPADPSLMTRHSQQNVLHVLLDGMFGNGVAS